MMRAARAGGRAARFCAREEPAGKDPQVFLEKYRLSYVDLLKSEVRMGFEDRLVVGITRQVSDYFTLSVSAFSNDAIVSFMFLPELPPYRRGHFFLGLAERGEGLEMESYAAFLRAMMLVRGHGRVRWPALLEKNPQHYARLRAAPVADRLIALLFFEWLGAMWSERRAVVEDLRAAVASGAVFAQLATPQHAAALVHFLCSFAPVHLERGVLAELQNPEFLQRLLDFLAAQSLDFQMLACALLDTDPPLYTFAMRAFLQRMLLGFAARCAAAGQANYGPKVLDDFEGANSFRMRRLLALCRQFVSYRDRAALAPLLREWDVHVDAPVHASTFEAFAHLPVYKLAAGQFRAASRMLHEEMCARFPHLAFPQRVPVAARPAEASGVPPRPPPAALPDSWPVSCAAATSLARMRTGLIAVRQAGADADPAAARRLAALFADNDFPLLVHPAFLFLYMRAYQLVRADARASAPALEQALTDLNALFAAPLPALKARFAAIYDADPFFVLAAPADDLQLECSVAAPPDALFRAGFSLRRYVQLRGDEGLNVPAVAFNIFGSFFYEAFFRETPLLAEVRALLCAAGADFAERLVDFPHLADFAVRAGGALHLFFVVDEVTAHLNVRALPAEPVLAAQAHWRRRGCAVHEVFAAGFDAAAFRRFVQRLAAAQQ